MGYPGWLLFLSLFRLLLLVSALARNITIDDQLGDQITHKAPEFSPSVAWATQTCSGCAIKPNVTEMYGGTFTAATFMPDKNIPFNAIDFAFNGTAVYIFFTLFNFEGEGVTVNTECNFTIDGHHVGYFNHTGDPNRPFQRDYQVPVFSKTDLDPMMHHMNINTSGIDYDVFTSFDYAVYTQTEPEQQTPGSKDRSSHYRAIVGGVIGGLCFLLGLLVAFWLYHRFHRKTPTLKPFPPTILDTSSSATQIPKRRLSQPLPQGSSPQPINENARNSAPGSPRYLTSSKRRSLAGHASNASIQHRRSIQGSLVSTGKAVASPNQPSGPLDGRNEEYRAPDELAEEVRRLRVELTRLKQNVTNSQVRVPGGGEAPPTYSATPAATPNRGPASVPVLYSPYTADVLISE